MNNMTSTFVLLMAGKGERSGLSVNKTLYKINGIPLFMYSLEKAVESGFDNFLIVVNENDYDEVKEIIDNSRYTAGIIKGGSERQESVKAALREVKCDVVFFHDAARPLVSVEDLKSLIKASENYSCGTLYHDCYDTLRYISNNERIDRNLVKGMSTPQFFRSELFDVILNNNSKITDEISLFEDGTIGYVKETSNNLKLTTKEDLEYLEYKLTENKKIYIGQSLDYHPYSNQGKLILGGVTFSDYPILDGHSDADVVYHAVGESILGASLQGDLGTLYPDTDPKYKGINSGVLLKDIVKRTNELGYEIVNIDVIVYLIKPNLKNYKKEMAKNISLITNCNHVNVKAATLNKRGLISLNEGIGCEAVCLIKK